MKLLDKVLDGPVGKSSEWRFIDGRLYAFSGLVLVIVHCSH